MEKTIKVFGIVGGPRRANSEYLLDRGLEVLGDCFVDTAVTKYALRGKKMQPCLACHRCVTHGPGCVLRDDFEELAQLWIASDVILYAFPVFAQGLPGQLKCFIDRLGHSFYGRYDVGSMRHMKVIGALVTGSHLFGGQELAMQQILQHAVLLNSLPVAGDGWQSYIGAAAWTANDLEGDALQRLVESGDRDAEVAITAAGSVVRRCVETAAVVRAGVEVLRADLGRDARYRPLIQRIDAEEA